MDQGTLFFESWQEALRDDVRALGGFKEVGRALFPEKDVESGARALMDRLNSGRRERLSDEQERMIIRMAGQARGYSSALHFLCDDAQFERPRAVAPGDKAAELQREFIQHIQRGERMLEALKRLTGNRT